MKKQSSFLLSIAVLLIALSAIAIVEPKHHVKVNGISFKTNIEFLAPQNAGLNAFLMLHPKNAALGKESICIMSVLYNTGQKAQMAKEKIDLLEYTRSVFMGSAVKGTAVKKTFKGKTAQGERFTKKIPRPRTAEVFIVPLKNGSSIALGFEWSPEIKPETVECLINEVGASFQE